MIKPNELRDIVHHSNRFWLAMYYDILLQEPFCQISFLPSADRLYYNVAHCLTSAQDNNLAVIEQAFQQHNLTPAIYWDDAAPKNLLETLKSRNYTLIAEEQENWYALDLQAPLPASYGAEITMFTAAEGTQLDNFIRINAAANNLPEDMAQNLKQRLLQQNGDIKTLLFIAHVDGQPAATLAVGIVNDMAFIAEAATLPAFQRKGLFLALTHAACKASIDVQCRAIYCNCDRDAFSNNGLQRYGFNKSFIRQFYQQKTGKIS